MKFAILTDIHLWDKCIYDWINRKINNNVKNLLKKFINEMNNNIKPEFVIVLGDHIEDINKIDDKKNIKYIVNLLKKLNNPVYYAIWNHDIKNLSEDELKKLFNQKSLYYSFDLNDFHFIILFSKSNKYKNIWISEEQINWLKKDLNIINKKTIIFVHHGLADQDLTNNKYFEWKPERCLIFNRKEIRNIFSESKKVIAVFNSHLHWNNLDIHDNIPYFTIQSLTENEDNKWIPSEAYAIVNINNNETNVEIKGNYPKKFSY